MTYPQLAIPRRLYLALAVTMVFLLFYLGGLPFPAGLIVEPWDKLAHFTVFAALTLLLGIYSGGRHPLVLILLVSAVGAIDEWHQAYLPDRSADIADLLVDVSAAVWGVALYSFLSARRRWLDASGRKAD